MNKDSSMSKEIINAAQAKKDEAAAVHASGNPNINFTQNPGYTPKAKGYPVEPGQTWHDVPPSERVRHMKEHEEKWKGRFGIENRGVQANMNWTRG